MIEFASGDDFMEIADLHVASLRATYPGIFPDSYFKKLSLETYINVWKRYLHRGDARTLVFRENNEIIGVAGVCLFKRIDKLPILDALHVKKAAQGKGVGKELIRAIKEMLRLEGMNAMLVDCVEGNENARNFYLKQGARYIGSFQNLDGGGLHFDNRYILEFDDKEHFNMEEKLSLGLQAEYERLKPYLREDYILWGVGNYYDIFFRQFKGVKPPKYIFDSQKEIQGMTANGVKIVKPHKTEIPIIITCSKYDEIEADIKQLGCESYVGFYPWHNYGDL